jgi:hypothetical protein
VKAYLATTVVSSHKTKAAAAGIRRHKPVKAWLEFVIVRVRCILCFQGLHSCMGHQSHTRLAVLQQQERIWITHLHIVHTSVPVALTELMKTVFGICNSVLSTATWLRLYTGMLTSRKTRVTTK